MVKLAYERPLIVKLNSGLMNKFGTRDHIEAVKEIDGVPVKKIISQYGSPCFVISERTIREKYREAFRAFSTRYPKIQFAWSYKTNYLDAVCRTFHSEGSWAEVVSIFEYEKAIANGVSGEKIIFNGPDKTQQDLKTAVEGNSLIHIDHLDELYLLAGLLKETGQKARVAIRVNMETGVYPIWDRFGFNFENGAAWSAINKIFANPGMELVGLHCHIGTYIVSVNAFATAAYKLCELARGVKEKYNKSVEYIDIGGGFATLNNLKGSYLRSNDIVPSFDDYAEAITTTILNFGFKPEDLPTLYLETGRALIDDAGFLLGSVVALKRLNDGRRATILDIGVNILFTSFWYDHEVSPAQDFTKYSEEMVLYGPLCMNIDVIRESVSLPLLNRGDHIVIHRVGAYNMTQWMQFIQMRPSIVMIDLKGEVHQIRKAETMQTLVDLELVPEHLSNTSI
jgi:diaminopimelate decarboxylase